MSNQRFVSSTFFSLNPLKIKKHQRTLKRLRAKKREVRRIERELRINDKLRGNNEQSKAV